jgi:dienelactone hydrolase
MVLHGFLLLTVLGTSGADDLDARRARVREGLLECMGPIPEKFRSTPLEPRVLEETALEKYVRKKVEYRVEPEDRIAAWLLVPKGLRGKAAAVLCLHQTTPIGKDEPAGLGKNQDLRYAAELAERGFVTLAPDCWDFGDYRSKAYDPFAHGYASGSMKSLWNHVRSIDYLETLAEVDRDRIGSIGHSLGGHNALWLAALDPRVKAVVTSCGFSSLASYAASPYGGGTLKNWAQKRYMPRIVERYGGDPKRVPWDWTDALATLAPRPVFICAPLRDENFLIEGVRECLRTAEPAYAGLGAAGNLVAVHPDAAHSFPKEAREAAYAFLEKHLRGKEREK